MHRIIEIIRVEERKQGEKTLYRTYALLDNQDEVMGFGKDFTVGDEVESFFHDKWGIAKMVKP